MQTDVKVFEPAMLQEIFPGVPVKNKTNGDYSVHVTVLNGDDLLKLIVVYLECAIDLFVSRYDKGMTVKITRHPENYISDKPRVLKIIPLEVE